MSKEKNMYVDVKCVREFCKCVHYDIERVLDKLLRINAITKALRTELADIQDKYRDSGLCVEQAFELTNIVEDYADNIFDEVENIVGWIDWDEFKKFVLESTPEDSKDNGVIVDD